MRLIILDRDGVINYESPYYIKNSDEWIPIPGSLEAIAALNQAGYTVTIATNQSGIGRGLYTEAILDQIHQKMQRVLQDLGGRIDKIWYCPHAPSDDCNCRKPQPGLLHAIAAWYGCALTGVPVIGDSWRDIEVARRIGCTPILVLTGNGEQTLEEYPELEKTIQIFPNLLAATEAIIHHGNQKKCI